MTVFRSLSSRITAIWERLTLPRDEVQPKARRRQSQLVMGTILALVVLIVFNYLVLLLTMVSSPTVMPNTPERSTSKVVVPDTPPTSVPYTTDGLELSMIVVFLCALGVAYYLSAHGRYEFGALLVIGALSVVIQGLGFSYPESDSFYLLYYLIAPMLFASVFFAQQAVFAVAIANILTMITLASILPGFTQDDMPVIFLTMFTAMTMIVSRHNQRLEKDRSLTLASSEERYRTLFDTISDGIVLYDHGILVEVNPGAENITGYRADEMVGRPLVDFLTPEYRVAVEQGLIRLGCGDSGELRVVHKSGRVLHLEIIVVEYTTPKGKVCAATIRDVTTRKEAESQKVALKIERERVNLMRQFISDASHDLRTPLTGILSGLHLVKIAPTQEYREQRIALLEQQAMQLNGLLDNLLTVSRLEKAAKGEFTFLRRDLNTLVEKGVAEQKLLASEKDVELNFHAGADLSDMSVDPQELPRALRQLLVNAITYTPTGGKVDVTTGITDDCAVIEVVDTGIGISPDNLKSIFSVFYREDPARTSDRGGLGLGLTISQRIVEAHSGHIEVTSEPGKGSTFRILLPLIGDMDEDDASTNDMGVGDSQD